MIQIKNKRIQTQNFILNMINKYKDLLSKNFNFHAKIHLKWTNIM
jgi:hypothetical protein